MINGLATPMTLPATPLVVEDIIARVVETAAGWLGLHEIQAGALAVTILGLYHFRHVTRWLSRAVGTLAIAGYVLFAVAAVGVVAVSVGALDVGTVPDVGSLVDAVVEVVR